MSTTLPLPPSIQGGLAGLARRIRFLAGVRGASLLLLVLSLFAGGALLADFLAGYALPSWARGALLGTWILVGLIVLLRCVIAPLTRRLDRADLAAAVEGRFPQLGERLWTTVELAEEVRPSSPALAGVLAREAEARSGSLDYNRAADGRSATLLVSAALAAMVLLLAPAVVFPKAFGTLANRFLLPWTTSDAEPDFAFAIEPGDAFAARGRPLAFAVTLSPRDERVKLPSSVQVVMTHADGTTARHTLAPDPERPAAFKGSVRIGGDAEYHVEAGNSASDAYAIRSVVPVELASDSPTATVEPPAYARATLETETATGLGDLSALVHSEIRFSFAFSRPAVAARIEWTPARDGAEAKHIPIVDGKASLPANEPGSYRVVLEAEHGIRTEYDGGKLVLRPDAPPALLKVVGAMDARKVRPYDRLKIEARLADDIALADAHLHWKANAAEHESEEPIKLDGAGKREAVARHVFQLAQKAKAGDVVHYRIRFRDNRPREYGGPNVAYHPEKGWLTLDVVDQAKSPREEEVAAQRDAINAKIDEARATLKQEMRASDKARAESRDEPALTREQREQVARVQKLNEDARKSLEELAALAEKEPETSPVADKAQLIRAEEMKKAGEALASALREDASPAQREKKFRDAEKEFHQALNKLDELKTENDKLARDRMDQAKVEELADKQKQLADKAAQLDKDDQKEAEALKREQEKAEKELKALADGSDLLRKAADDARAEQARQEAEKAAELAREQRDVAKAAAETEKKREGERLAGLAKEQDDLAARAEKLAKETARALEANRSQPLKPDDAKRAAQSLDKGESDRAMNEQDRAARDLDKLARDLDRFADQGKDPREAARQLAILEEGLARRTRESPALSPEAKKELVAEQKAIREALAELSMPQARKDLASEKRKALEALAEAEEALAKGEKEAAAQRMDEAKAAMRRLASKLPTLEERRRDARAELQKFRAQQEELARLLDLAKRPGAPEGRMDEVQRKQESLASRLGKLDAPALEERRDRAREEMAQAIEDLKRRDGDDAQVSQDRAQKALDRLAEALAGNKPADEKASDLARRQRELMARPEQADAKWKQRQLADEAAKLDAPDAPAAKRDAAKAADEAAKTPTREAMAEAAKKLEKLAEALAGKESDAARADRLAKRQGEAAEKASREGKTDAEGGKAAAEELKNLRGGDARAEKKAAQMALDKAAKAAPADRAKAERDAADKLAELADKLAGRKTDGEKAAEIARAQKDLADDAARGKKGLQDRQSDLARQAEKLGEKAGDTRKAMDDSRKAMADEHDAPAKAEAAARAAEKLARDLGGDPTPRKQERADAGKKGSPLAGKQQADAARRLAQEQRDLKDAVRRQSEAGQGEAGKGEASDKLAKEQAEIAREAGELAKSVKGEQGEKSPATAKAGDAGKATEQASRDLSSGALEKAAKGGEASEKALRDLAQSLKDTPRGTKPGEADTLETARKLAKRQGDLNKELAPKAGDTSAQRAQQDAKQEGIEKAAGDLAQRLEKMAGQPSPQPGAQEGAGKGAEAAREAKEAMRQAKEAAKKGNPSMAQAARERAAQALDRAAEQAAKAGGKGMGEGQPGKEVAQAKGEMGKAGQQLGKGRPQDASRTMQSAADALKRAAEQLAKAMQPAGQPSERSNPSDTGAKGGGAIDDRKGSMPKLPFDAKRWGDLPGELKTKITQEMRARYGDDYARMIKLYFEQLADTKGKR